MLEFIDNLDAFNRENNPLKSSKGTNINLSSREFLYQRFLLYSEIFAASTPVIICEGKTDNVYLVHAIRSLANQFPLLAEIDSRVKSNFE